MNDGDKMNRTALHLACANGHSARVTLLLERKYLPNSLCDNEKRTVLMKAVECQAEESATILLEHGADPNVTNVSSSTALHYAAFCQNMSLAAENKDDLTPLLLTVSERKQQMVEFLVKKEANIHVFDKKKRTALMFAVSYESNAVSLLQHSVNIFSQDVFGWTAEELGTTAPQLEFTLEQEEKRSLVCPMKKLGSS
uniref:Uncharacterized protein n=1 Tax=Capra hircus TaxID=9925 RepID=A0A8C2PK09_CAPHI